MKIYFACRFGLGDILAGYLSPLNYRKPNPRAQLFMRLRNACRAGACTSTFAVSRFSFWESLDFPLRVRTPNSFAMPLPDHGWDLDELEDHRNLLRPPDELWTFPADPPVPIPMRRPAGPIPENYILFSDGAGVQDRALDDREIVQWLEKYLPVVRVGSSVGSYSLPMGPRGSTAAQVDLVDATDLIEVFWLARHARFIVAPCTYLRTMSALVGTPVLELLQGDRAEPNTIARTITEYCGFEYGMRPGELNFWGFWNGHASDEVRSRVEQLISARRRIHGDVER